MTNLKQELQTLLLQLKEVNQTLAAICTHFGIPRSK